MLQDSLKCRRGEETASWSSSGISAVGLSGTTYAGEFVVTAAETSAGAAPTTPRRSEMIQV